MPYTPDVLVIEDDFAIRELIAETLSEEGYRIVALSSGIEAIATTIIPRLILLDRHLIDCDGDEVFAALRRNPALARVPIVLMSASTSVHRYAAALSADGVIAKPFQLDALVACVGGLLQRSPALSP